MGKSIEHKNKIGGPELGKPRKESNLHSSQDGVPILNGEGHPRQMIREMEKLLGISSWIDNI